MALILSVLIQGPKQPGNDIDVYLGPLVEELLQLWSDEGVRVWDEHEPQHRGHVPCFADAVLARLQPGKRDRKSTRLNSSHSGESRMPSSA